MYHTFEHFFHAGSVFVMQVMCIQKGHIPIQKDKSSVFYTGRDNDYRFIICIASQRLK